MHLKIKNKWLFAFAMFWFVACVFMLVFTVMELFSDKGIPLVYLSMFGMDLAFGGLFLAMSTDSDEDDDDEE